MKILSHARFTEPNRYLVWLNWPVGAFRLDVASHRVLASLVSGGDIVVVRGERAFLRELPTATHAIVWEFKREWFTLAKRLRVLATPGAGRELLPADDEMPKEIVRVNGAFHGQIMSETVLACMFAHARGLYPAYDWQVRSGMASDISEGTFPPARDPRLPMPVNPLWPRGELSPYCTRVAGSKAVILGYGKIGHAIGAKLEALGVAVAGIRRSNFGTLKTELKTADWLIVALPSDTGTDNLVDASVLRAMKRSAVLINVGRGNAIDEQALARALRERRLAAAFLDVFKGEPLTEKSPLAENLPGLIRLPHASAFAPDYLSIFFHELAANGWL